MEDRTVAPPEERVQSKDMAEEHPARTSSAGEPEPHEGGSGPRPSSMLLSKLTPETFSVVESFRIGHGTFANVFASACGKLALKHVHETPWFILECCVLQTLRGCPFVVPLLGTNARHRVMVMPRAYMSADEYGTRLCGASQPTTRLVRAWAWQLLRAVQEAHGRGVLHRDIKPQNVLVEEGGSLLLADWNSASFSSRDVAKIDPKQAGESNFRCDTCTITSRAPETLGENARAHGVCSDVWSTAVTLCQMFARAGKRMYPWTDVGDLAPDSEAVTMTKLCILFGKIHSFGWDHLRHFPDAKDQTFEQRRDVVRAILHPGIDAGFLDLMTFLLDMDHRTRPGIAAALKHPFFRGVTDETSRQMAREEMWKPDPTKDIYDDRSFRILRRPKTVEVVSLRGFLPWKRPEVMSGTDVEIRRHIIGANVPDQDKQDLVLRGLTQILPGEIDEDFRGLPETGEQWEFLLRFFEVIRWSMPVQLVECNLVRKVE